MKKEDLRRSNFLQQKFFQSILPAHSAPAEIDIFYFADE